MQIKKLSIWETFLQLLQGLAKLSRHFKCRGKSQQEQLVTLQGTYLGWLHNYIILNSGEKSENGHAHTHIWSKCYLENRMSQKVPRPTKMLLITSLRNPEKMRSPSHFVADIFKIQEVPFLSYFEKVCFLHTNNPGVMLKHLEVVQSSLEHCYIYY